MATMTRDEIMKHLHTNFMEEVKAADKYCDMIEAAERMDRPDLYEGLCEMANDEHSHAEFICMVMKQEGEHLTAEEETKWKELESRMERLFR